MFEISGRSRVTLACLIGGWLSLADAANYSITVNAADKQEVWNRFYEKAVATCHVGTVLRSAYNRNLQNALKRGHDEAGFQYFRGHSIFGPDVGVYTENNGVPVYTWARFDSIYDLAKAAGVRPILELSYVPGPMAVGTDGFGWYNGSPGNRTLPKDFTKYRNLIAEVVRHCESRYGADEIRNNWLFEVYNEPDLFLSGTENDYLKMYDYAAEGVKDVDPQVRIGGPAVSGGSNGPSRIGRFLTHCKSDRKSVV